MQLDILAFGAHPDDVELAASGTLASHIARGHKAGIVDLTRGELGSRGSVELRNAEAANSAAILKLSARENLDLEDGFFENNQENQLKVVKVIRKYRPSIVLANALTDRHPDHGRAAELIKNAFFLSGLTKIETTDEHGVKQNAFRPKALYHYIQSNYIEPDFVVDISEHWETKMAAIKAFSSQFYSENADDAQPSTFISSPEFMSFIAARNQEFGLHIGVKYAEGFCKNRLIGITDLTNLL